MASASSNPFLVFLLVGIYLIVGPLSIIGVFFESFLIFSIELLRICESISVQSRERVREGREQKRKIETSTIIAGVAAALTSITAEENAKSEAEEGRFLQKRAELVAEMKELGREKWAVGREVNVLRAEKHEQAEGANDLSRRKRAMQLEVDALQATLTDQKAQEQAQAERTNRLSRQKLALQAEVDSLQPQVASLQSQVNALRSALVQQSPQPIHQARGQITLPESLENLDPTGPGFTCIGTTLKKQRCGQYMISTASKTQASKRLEEMRSGTPEENFSEDKLLELANWMLCPRWHRDKKPQGDEIARRWYLELKEASRQTQSASRALGSSPFQTPGSAASSYFSGSGGFSSQGSASPWTSPSSVSSDGSIVSERLFGSASANLTSRFQEIADQRR